MYLLQVLSVPKLGLLLVIILCLGTVTLWLKDLSSIWVSFSNWKHEKVVCWQPLFLEFVFWEHNDSASRELMQSLLLEWGRCASFFYNFSKSQATLTDAFSMVGNTRQAQHGQISPLEEGTFSDLLFREMGCGEMWAEVWEVMVSSCRHQGKGRTKGFALTTKS